MKMELPKFSLSRRDKNKAKKCGGEEVVVPLQPSGLFPLHLRRSKKTVTFSKPAEFGHIPHPVECRPLHYSQPGFVPSNSPVAICSNDHTQAGSPPSGDSREMCLIVIHRNSVSRTICRSFVEDRAIELFHQVTSQRIGNREACGLQSVSCRLQPLHFGERRNSFEGFPFRIFDQRFHTEQSGLASNVLGRLSLERHLPKR